MSIRLMDLALRAQGIEPVAKLILTQIANHADEDGDAWCYARELSEVTGRDERTVRRSLRQLEELGVLVTTARAGEAKRVPSHLKPNAYRVIEARLVELKPSSTARTPVTGQSEKRPDTDDPSLGETGHPRPHRPVTGVPSRPVTHDPTESSTETSTESSLSSEHNTHPEPEPVDNDDDPIDESEADIVALVAVKLVDLEQRTGKRPRPGYGVRCAANLQPTGPDHGQVLDLRRLRLERPDLDRNTAARIVLGIDPDPAIQPVSLATVTPIDRTVHDAVSFVIGLALTGELDEARTWIDQSCPPHAKTACLDELERRAGRTAS